MNRTPELILALDVDNFDRAKNFVHKLYPRIKIFKVGPQLFTAAGPEIIEFINEKGAGAFLDLKLFDIPNTVANAVGQALRLKVKMLTLHIQGGKEMLKAAVKAADEESRKVGLKRPLLIGVTVLTSQSAGSNQVLRLARAGLDCGLEGVVCAAKEARLLRKKIRQKFLIITPGIRSEGHKKDDQSRIATAQEAVKAGADYLVVGRPILEAKNPIKATEKIFESLQ